MEMKGVEKEFMKFESHYIGRMCQPLLHPDIDNPTMFLLRDQRGCELDLLLLTPGFFSHAYRVILQENIGRVRLFLPSCGIEYISDLYNLYRSFDNRKDIQWIFPNIDGFSHLNHIVYPNFESSQYVRFLDGKKSTSWYVHPNDTSVSISYIDNPHVIGLYDLVVKTPDQVHYFANYITKERAMELYEDSDYDSIHIPYSTPMYGGISYKELLKFGTLYRQKFIPNSFLNEEEYREANAHGRDQNGTL